MTNTNFILILSIIAIILAAIALVLVILFMTQNAPNPTGVMSFYEVTNTLDVTPSIKFPDVSVSCDTGDVAVGGGGSTTDVENFKLDFSAPWLGTQWRTIWTNSGSISGHVYAHVVCADFGDPHNP